MWLLIHAFIVFFCTLLPTPQKPFVHKQGTETPYLNSGSALFLNVTLIDMFTAVNRVSFAECYLFCGKCVAL